MIVDLFGGPGGWDVAAAWLDRETVGIEVDADACATRAAAGLATIRADVSTVPLEPLAGRVTGLIASPPCQAFSLAGKQLGHDDLPRIFAAIRGWPTPWDPAGWSDPRSALILEPLRWAWTLRPRWVACEQVKPCIEVWRALGAKLEEVGYRWWAGVCNAADFGIVAPCPLHATDPIPVGPVGFAELPSRYATALATAAAHATTKPDVAPLLDAAIVVAHSAKAIEAACAADATCGGRLDFLARRVLEEIPTRSGAAVDAWMTAATSEFGLTGDIVESIGSWLSACWADLSRAGRLSTMSTSPSTTTIRATLRCIAATLTTSPRTGPARRSAGCGLCVDIAVPQTRERAIFMASLDFQPHPPRATHGRDPQAGLFGEPLERWVSMAAALGWIPEHVGEWIDPETDPSLTVCGHIGPRWAFPRAGQGIRGSHGGQVGFPRRDDRGDSPDGYRERDWRSTDDPAPTLTEKGRSWVVRTGANSMVTGRTEDDIEPYERSMDEPAPTLDAKAGGAWKMIAGNQPNAAVRGLDEPAPTVAFGHNASAHRFEQTDAGSNTGLWWKKGGDRADAQERPAAEPAPAVTAKSGGQWHLHRPATTVQGDARLWPPGHKVNQDDRDRLGADEADARYGDRAGTDAIRLTIEDALILQSFPADYPVQGTKTAKFRQIGDAVPPMLAYCVLRELLDPERA